MEEDPKLFDADFDKKMAHIRYIAYSVVAPVIVGIGILGNILNLFVLTRPFLKGGTRVFLTALAISDLGVMLSAIPMVFRLNNSHGTTISSAFYHAHIEIFLTNIFIGSSVFIVVCLTVERYFSVCLPTVFRSVHTKRNAKKAIFGSFLTSIIVGIPLTTLKIVCVNNKSSNCTKFSIQENTIITDTIYWNIYLLISECIVRIGPFFVVATLNVLIIKKFRVISAKRKLLRTALCKNNHKNMFAYNKDPNFRKSLRNRRFQEEKRLIRLLRAIVLLFLITMTPTAVLSILYSEKYEPAFEFQVFRATANNLELANFALNFYVYCLCSKDFRTALVKVVTGCFMCEDDPNDAENVDEDYASNVMKSYRTSEFDSNVTKV